MAFIEFDRMLYVQVMTELTEKLREIVWTMFPCLLLFIIVNLLIEIILGKDNYARLERESREAIKKSIKNLISRSQNIINSKDC